MPEQVTWHNDITGAEDQMKSNEKLQTVTPLMAAVSKGWTEVAAALIDAGANPSADEERGPSVLELVQNEDHEWRTEEGGPPPDFNRQELADLMRRSSEA
eukprot:SAG31_NODE_447_length_15579_cov_5.713871_13_plen_100_part_00